MKGTEVTVLSIDQDDYISLTDIARYKDSANTDAIIQNWLRNRNTIELLGFGKQYTTPILNPSNSRGLENRRD